MITIGVDAHKGVHVAVATDRAGRELGRWQGKNSLEEWERLLVWAQSLGEDRTWGIEGAWNYGRGLAQRLVGTGERVYEVNPRLTAQGRRRARRRDKSDRLDALAVAAAVLREGEGLPLVEAEDDAALLEVLDHQRESALADATRLRNQIHQHLVQTDPEYKERLPGLDTKAGLRAVLAWSYDGADQVKLVRAGLVRSLAKRLELALLEAEELAGQMRKMAGERFLDLTLICGVGLLSAGQLAGALGPGDRFRTDSQLALHAGVAPLEASSAGAVRHRLNRGGDRRLNHLFHQIALTQSRCSEQARAYISRRMSEGRSWREAVRALKRYIARAVLGAWRRCLGRDSMRDVSLSRKQTFQILLLT